MYKLFKCGRWLSAINNYFCLIFCLISWQTQQFYLNHTLVAGIVSSLTCYEFRGQIGLMVANHGYRQLDGHTIDFVGDICVSMRKNLVFSSIVLYNCSIIQHMSRSLSILITQIRFILGLIYSIYNTLKYVIQSREMSRVSKMFNSVHLKMQCFGANTNSNF